MSEKLTIYFRTAMVATVDMALGTLVSTIVQSFFGVPKSGEAWIKLLTEAWLEGMLSVLIGGELRSTVFPETFDDPTMGLMFMATVLRQPVLWERVNILQTMFVDWIFGKSYDPPGNDEDTE